MKNALIAALVAAAVASNVGTAAPVPIGTSMQARVAKLERTVKRLNSDLQCFGNTISITVWTSQADGNAYLLQANTGDPQVAVPVIEKQCLVAKP